MEKSKVRLIYRDPAPISRPLLKGTDMAQVGWLVVSSVVASVLPKSALDTAARALRRLKHKEQAEVMTKSMAIGSLKSEQGRACSLELSAKRIETYLNLFRGLIWHRDIEVDCVGLVHLNAALAGGRGAVLWIADFAEAPTASKIGFFNAGHPLAHLSRPEHGFSKSRFGIACLNPFRTRYEDRFLKQRILYDRQKPQLAEEAILLRLAENGVVSVMASAHEGRVFADVKFLNGWLRLATGAIRFARKAGCPVLPVFTVPADRACSYRVIVERPLSSAEDSDEDAIRRGFVLDFSERLESYVRRWPGAWVGWRRPNLTISHQDPHIP